MSEWDSNLQTTLVMHHELTHYWLRHPAQYTLISSYLYILLVPHVYDYLH